MAMRLSGLMSGMDTESIIQQLVEAKSVKVTNAKKAQTKLEWKQDAWKELNTKLKNLQSKFLGNMRFTSAYAKKVTKVSNSSAVSVITGENAVNGVQSLKIDQLAKTGYMTGGVVVADKDSDVSAMTKLSELVPSSDGTISDGTISVKAGNTSVDIKVTGETTISDVLSQLKKAGLNASFDAKWKRFSISSKNSGSKSDFSITAADGDGWKALKALKLVNTDKESADYTVYNRYSEIWADHLAGDDSKLNAAISEDVASREKAYLAQYKSLTDSLKSAQEKVKDFEGNYSGVSDYAAEIKIRNDNIAQWKEDLKDESLSDDDKKTLNDNIAKAQTEVKELQSLNTVKDLEGQLAKVQEYVKVSDDGETAKATDKLRSEVIAYQNNKAEEAWNVKAELDAVDPDKPPAYAATKVNGQDAVIYLNGAKYENDNNTFEINGLTFTALNETKNEEITVTTEQDVDGIYDMVKNFLKEYNSVINEMDKLYNAASSKGYEPLSDEEREAMSDTDIEKYEQKIKDALLRKDDNLSTVSSALKSIMSSGIEVGGKTMYLFDFGIETLSYFNAPDNEKNAYHIDGDPDDTNTAGESDKLKGMIANSPDTVISFFTKLSQNLYDKMSDLSSSVTGYRSFGSFYDDKKMKSDYDDYTSKIKDLEQKLNDYEDKWYKKFAAMETAMSKMQQNTNAVTALLGGGQ